MLKPSLISPSQKQKLTVRIYNINKLHTHPYMKRVTWLTLVPLTSILVYFGYPSSSITFFSQYFSNECQTWNDENLNYQIVYVEIPLTLTKPKNVFKLFLNLGYPI